MRWFMNLEDSSLDFFLMHFMTIYKPSGCWGWKYISVTSLGYSSILTFCSAVLLNNACSTDSSFRYCHGVGSFKGVNEVFIPLLLLEITVSRTLTQED